MPADPTVIRHLAGRLRDQADDIRATARAATAAAAATPWRGRAGEAMRAGTHEQVRDLERTAELHEEAAARLVEHAARVEETQALVAAVEQQVHDLVGAARGRLAGVLQAVAGVVDAADVVLDTFVGPPPGSLDWLAVDLPGLRLPACPWVLAA